MTDKELLILNQISGVIIGGMVGIVLALLSLAFIIFLIKLKIKSNRKKRFLKLSLEDDKVKIETFDKYGIPLLASTIKSSKKRYFFI